MNFNVLSNDEKTIFALRSLYSGYGYGKYTMSKFEQYDFYVRNKDFLVSDNIITFTDSDGKLMALKPDVTLSIIKSSKDCESTVKKVYYNENVYRASGSTKEIKEIMQTGLECIGDIDCYCICEVVLLAAKSLECICSDYVLDISHMGIISEALSFAKVSEGAKAEILRCLGEKNLQGIEAVCQREDVADDASTLLKTLVTLYGNPKDVIEKLEKVSVSKGFTSALNQLKEITEILSLNGCAENCRIDFSVVNNMNYYSGVAFKGFINGVHGGVLSGGQYDGLMNKMKRNSGAIGFAVYIDMLSELYDGIDDFDTDAVLLYSETDDVSDINNAIRNISQMGKTVMAQREIPKKIRCKEIFKLQEGRVTKIEYNA